MVSTFTPNIQLEEPARGDQVGTWDTPVNNNMTLLDLVAGNIATISLNNSNVALSAAQFQSKGVTFNSTLTGSVIITFPTSFKKSYEIFNTCTGTSAFTITLQTTAAGGQVICCPPGEIVDVVNDGTNIRFKNLGRVGEYWDYAGSSVPAWVSGCTVAPYLNCDGTTFSSATFPQLATILGSTTLPDFRGRGGVYLNQGTNRITTTGAGIDGNTNHAVGGGNGVTMGASNIPTLTTVGNNSIVVFPNGTNTSFVPLSVNGNAFLYGPDNGGNPGPTFSHPYGASGVLGSANSFSGVNTITTTYSNASQQAVPATIPISIAGLRLIRAG